MSSRYVVLCGVPYEHCSGTKLFTDQHFSTNSNSGGGNKCHHSHTEAYKCMCNYLVNVLGFSRLSSREFKNPENGYIRILTRQSKFGYHMRSGKAERYMPENHSGVIIG